MCGSQVSLVSQATIYIYLSGLTQLTVFESPAGIPPPRNSQVDWFPSGMIILAGKWLTDVDPLETYICQWRSPNRQG